MESWGKSVTCFRREYCHQLLEGSERLSKFKSGLFFNKDIWEERCIVKRVEPGPTGNSFVVVQINPTQSLNISYTDTSSQFHKLLRGYSKFLSIIFLLVVIEMMTKNWIIFKVIFKVDLFFVFLLECKERVRNSARFLVINNCTLSLLLFLLNFLSSHFLPFGLVLLEDNLWDDIFLIVFHFVDEYSQTFMLNFTSFRDIILHDTQAIFVYSHQYINSSLSDGQTWNMR